MCHHIGSSRSIRLEVINRLCFDRKVAKRKEENELAKAEAGEFSRPCGGREEENCDFGYMRRRIVISYVA